MARTRRVRVGYPRQGSSIDIFDLKAIGRYGSPIDPGPDPDPNAWTPANLVTGFVAPPTGSNYVRYEDLYAPGDTLRQVLAKVTGMKILTLPEGTFSWSGFSMVNTCGLRLEPTSVGAGGAQCGGIIGSGRGTILTMVASSASASEKAAGNITSGTNQVNQIMFQSVVNPVFQNLTLQGQDQGTYYNGVCFYKCTAPLVSGVYLRGASPGWSGAPPGETFGVNFYLSPNATIRDSEIDGRHPTTGVAKCASPFGWNTCNDAVVERMWCHHGAFGMPTWWEVVNITTTDLWSYQTGTAGINHERASGTIFHLRPNLRPAGKWATDDPARTNVDTVHMTYQNDQRDMPTFRMEQPTFDRGPAGVFSIYCEDSYGPNHVQLATTFPVIVLNGTQLEVRKRYVQWLNRTGAPSAGSFVLAINGSPTAAISYNADNEEVRSKLQAVMNTLPAAAGRTISVNGTRDHRDLRWNDCNDPGKANLNRAKLTVTIVSQSITGGAVALEEWNAPAGGLDPTRHATLAA